MVENEESLAFALLAGQKKESEDVTLNCDEHFSQSFDINRDNNLQINQ